MQIQTLDELVTKHLRKVKVDDNRVIIRSKAVIRRMESKTIEHAKHAFHSKRISIIATKMADRLGKDVHANFLAGLDHDAGKLFTPADLLKDDDHFDAQKHKLVQPHAVAGYDLFKDISLSLALTIGRVHNTDNMGYGIFLADFPSNMSKAEIDTINFNSALVSICDYIDSNKTRPLRPGKDVLHDGIYVSLEEQLFKKYPQCQEVVEMALSVYEELF